MKRLPPIDLHAHIEADISASDLIELGALIFAATRSLDEAEQALRRSDPWTVWGVGCHPGLVGAQKSFDRDHFADLITRTAYVSEIGLDGKSRVPMDIQRTTFRAMLQVLQTTPRITSIHSFSATGDALDCLAAYPIDAAVLHWWLGDAEQTQRAVELGCFFSINAAMLLRPEVVSRLPLDRLLTETDHPFGDRSGGRDRRPGEVGDVERATARLHGLEPDEVRRILWRNFGKLTHRARCGGLLPRPVRVTLAAVG